MRSQETNWAPAAAGATVFASLLYRDGLCEVPRFVHVVTPMQGSVIGEELKRHRADDGREDAGVVVQIHQVHAFAVGQTAVGVGEYVELPATGADFLQVGFQLVEQRVAR